MKVTVDVKNAQATEETRGSDMVAEGMMEHGLLQGLQTSLHDEKEECRAERAPLLHANGTWCQSVEIAHCLLIYEFAFVQCYLLCARSSPIFLLPPPGLKHELKLIQNRKAFY